jgi:acyl-coenzyme A synthetase/AMP-(fatty) acid ligase
VVAVVVAAHGGDPPTLDDLRAHVAQQAQAWLAPRELRLVADLPRLPSGKVDRKVLT